MSDPTELVCHAWDTAVSAGPVPAVVPCTAVVDLTAGQANPRFCYVSVASPIERLVDGGRGSAVLRSRTGEPLDTAALSERLLVGDVAAVLAPLGPLPNASGAPSVELSEVHRTRRQEIRHANVRMRFLLRQIGLEEVSSHRGAAPALYEAAATTWSLDLALCIDPAMLLTLGADRQRHVDVGFEDRATDRLPRALGRLHDLGVRSYPRLVIA